MTPAPVTPTTLTHRLGRDPIVLARIISRLNIGGPAIQAITLSRLLEPRGYKTLLLCGGEGPREGNMDRLARQLEVTPIRLPYLSRDPRPADTVAILSLALMLRRARPQVVHTHTAKAGTVGRVATLIAFPRRPRVLVHTFHGHSLTGYFDARRARFFLAVERALARRTTKLVAVSEEVRDELVALGVASADRFEVIPLGFDLTPFAPPPEERSRLRHNLRAEFGIPQDTPVVTLVARLVPIKRVDRFLRVARLIGAAINACFVVVGDGELRELLQQSEDARSLGESLVWTGFRHDMAAVYLASDVVALTSDNEGTPVSLIEAQAAGVPVVSTDVGGVRSAVLDGRSGLVVGRDDVSGFADAVLRILRDSSLPSSMAAAGASHARSNFSIERLLSNLDQLYRTLLDADPRL